MSFNKDDYTQPPFTNGVMDLAVGEISLVKGRLEVVASEFVPDEYTPVIDTFYLTATYNRTFPNEAINGDTCEMCRSYKQEPDEEPVEEEQPTEPIEEEEPVEEPVEEV
ncbi:hypothetical protein [Priestia endophytica]|uniref:hypothetical protein n=1 Tax=Priestia endophytica TaxID=135735 RepID=UPI00203EA92D|nr:hypothetical protein [Priestia endophytica]MCM3536597.1 hypothetical protein [Priestia endophytica]